MRKLLGFLILLWTLFFSRTVGASGFESGDERDAVRRAIAWLVRTIESKAWDDPARMVSVTNGPGLRDVATLAAAWAMEANPDLAEFGSRTRARLRERADRTASGAVGDNQANNWVQGVAALYVYERSLRDGKAHPALDGIARGFLQRQNGEGGWGHGRIAAPPDDAPPGFLYYPSTLIATTNLALTALGAVKRLGTPVSREVDFQFALNEGLKLLRDAQGSQGGMPYSGRPYRRHCEAGRTASMLLTLAVLQQTDGELFRRAAMFVLDNKKSIPYGHASGPLHIALGGMACSILSDDAWRGYQRIVLKRIRSVQRQDGSFGNNAYPSMDVLFAGGGIVATAYTTALYAVALCAKQTAVSRELLLPTPFRQAESRVKKVDELPAPAWEVHLSDVLLVEADGRIVAVLHEDGTLTCIAADSGQVVGKIVLPAAGRFAQALKLRNGKIFVSYAAPQEKSSRELGDGTSTARSARASCFLACYDPKKEKPEWRTKIDEPLSDLWTVGEDVVVLTPSRLVVVDAAAGRILHSLSVAKLKGELNSAILPLPDRRYVFGAEAHLVVCDGAGKTLWEADKVSVERGLCPPRFSALAASTDRLYTGGTDARIECRNLKDGKILWDLGLSNCCRIVQMYVVGTKPDRLVIVDEDGLVHRVEDGRVVYRVNAGSGREQVVSSDKFVPALAGRLTLSSLLLVPPGSERMACVAVDRGEKSWLPLTKCWSAAGGRLITWSDGRLRAYTLP